MGFKKSWDVSNITSQIHSLSRECNSPHNDGFTAWGCKQDLLIIQQLINEAIKVSPNFGEMEADWLKSQEQKRIIKILKQ
mgnify:FL=1|jgi:hypothetical protein